MQHDAGIFIPLILQHIVVTLNKMNGERGKIFSPPAEPFQLFIAFTMEHISHYHHLLRLKELNEAHEALHIFFKDRLRHPDACFAEVPGLAQVKISKDKGFLLFPKNTTASAQP